MTSTPPTPPLAHSLTHLPPIFTNATTITILLPYSLTHLLDMNFFGNEPTPAGPSPMFAAKTDLDMYSDLFNK